MFFLHGLSVAALGGAIAVSSAVAQNYIPRKITFSGTNMSQSGLLAVSGLKPGEALGQQDIQAAAQKLIDTGLFSDVQFSFNGLELNFALKMMDGLQPVSYANFPWWDDAALTAAVAATVPLFRGAIPAQSPMQQEVAAALTELLAEKGVIAKVTGVPRESLDADKGAGIEYQIDAPPVQVATFHLSGVSADWTEPVLAIQKAAVGQDFGPATGAALEASLRAIYHRQGYLQMAVVGFAHETPEVVDGKVMVPVSATIEQGPQYRVRDMHFTGDSVMTADEFGKIAKLHLADIANEDLLHGTLAEMATTYRRKGYLRAKLDAIPSFDAMTRTVDYTIKVQPGPVFTQWGLWVW